MKIPSTLLGLGFLLIIAACSTGGFTVPPGSQCTPGANPVLMTGPTAQAKLTNGTSGLTLLNKDANAAAANAKQAVYLQPGYYTYSRADVYYNQNPTTSPMPLTVQLLDLPSNSGTVSNIGFACVLNAQPVMATQSVVGNAVTDIVIDSSYNMTVTVRQMNVSVSQVGSFSIINKPNPLVISTTDISADLAFAHAATGMKDVISFFVFQINPNLYEINASYLGDNGDTLYVAVQLTYSVTAPVVTTTVTPTPTPPTPPPVVPKGA